MKLLLAILVAQRHVVQIFFDASSKWRILLNNWLSNLAVPVFFTIAGFFLFQKLEEEGAGNASSARKKNRDVVFRYCGRILRMYVVWSILYLPVDIYNWHHSEEQIGEDILHWLHSFVFCSTIPQLWYLPALALACLLVWLAWSKGMKPWQILAVGMIFLVCGYLGDNWYYNQHFPQRLQEMLALYRKMFLTPRNGIFYGIFYVSLGLVFARNRYRLSTWGAGAGCFFFLWCMYWEVMKISDAGSNTNFVLFAAPAAYCLFTAASAMDWKPRRACLRMREMSQWVYLSHFYFFHFLSWLRPWNPVPFTSKSITVMVMVPVLLFSWVMSRLSETDRGRWLRKLI